MIEQLETDKPQVSGIEITINVEATIMAQKKLTWSFASTSQYSLTPSHHLHYFYDEISHCFLLSAFIRLT